jgi:hypothetical protein
MNILQVYLDIQMAIKDKILSYSIAFLLDKINGQNKKCFTIDEAYFLFSNSAKDNAQHLP